MRNYCSRPTPWLMQNVLAKLFIILGVSIVPAYFLSLAPCTSDTFSVTQYLPKAHECVLNTISYHSNRDDWKYSTRGAISRLEPSCTDPVQLLVTWFLNYNNVQHHKVSPPAVSYPATVYHEGSARIVKATVLGPHWWMKKPGSPFIFLVSITSSLAFVANQHTSTLNSAHIATWGVIVIGRLMYPPH